MTLAEVFLTVALFTVSVETPAQIQVGWEALGHEGQISAYASWHHDTDPPQGCVIHVPLLTLQTLDTWLHEIEHCRSGRWHK